MADKSEWMPWYRRKSYKGNLSEEEKRMLDSFRLKENHPAASYADLPNEVQSYITRIELELYDKKQERALVNALTVTGIVALVFFLAYKDIGYNSLLTYPFGVTLFLLGWFKYRRDWKKNASDLFPKEDGAPNQTDQGIQAEWELDYIVRRKMEKDLEI